MGLCILANSKLSNLPIILKNTKSVNKLNNIGMVKILITLGNPKR